MTDMYDPTKLAAKPNPEKVVIRKSLCQTCVYEFASCEGNPLYNAHEGVNKKKETYTCTFYVRS
jgi:hypothetical protein